MFDITLFGAGRFGRTWHNETYDPILKVPDCQVKAREMLGGRPVIPDVEYQVYEFQVDGEIYLIGINGKRPSEDVIKSHIRHGEPKPRPYKPL